MPSTPPTRTWFVRLAFTVCIIAVTIAATMTVSSLRGDDVKAKKQRVFELRTYTTAPGKLDALHKRFRDHTNRLFIKHGMELVGFWTPMDGEQSKNTLVYMLAYPSREARKKAWKAFLNDPDWKKAYKESRADGPIVIKVQSKFLSPTDYSPIK